jgi:D-alanyl-D-alanine carboxypeptidase/D-alanyl-D-alanine-endopeptidase (penicillin-binding protein 4)
MDAVRTAKFCLWAAINAALVASPVLGANETSTKDNPDAYVEALRKRLAFIFRDQKLDRTQLGIEVYSLSRQESLFRLNADTPLSPASAVKALTGLVALKRLGPDFTYKTEVYMDGPIRNGVLEGNLYLKGGGDPSLVTERLFLLANDVMRSGLRSVKGNVIVDDWTFDQVRVDPARIPTNTDRAYNAPVGGLNFNYNTTTVYFRPGGSAGMTPAVLVEPDTGYIGIRNQARTSTTGGKYLLQASRLPNGALGDLLSVTGSIPAGMGEQRSYFNIVNPSVYAGTALKWLLGLRGVRFEKAEVQHKQVPSSARKVATLESLPLREIVTLMNKFSNNFIADTLVKTLGREIKGGPGSMDKGLEVVMEESTRLGMNTKGFKVVSGSGLTRDNRISAHQFVTLLNGAYLDFDVLPELLASLPIAGRDGTLRSRMKGTSAFGRLRGKTGTIDGVSSIVGMVQSRGGELLAFSVLMNDNGSGGVAYRSWQDYFGQALADFNRDKALSEEPTPVTASAEDKAL